MIHFYVGEVLYNRGLNDDALASLKRAIEFNPDNPDAHYLMGFVLGDMGRHEEARTATKRAIQLNPTLSRAQANLSLDQYNPQKYEELLPAAPRTAQPAADEVSADGQLAHVNLGLAFGRRAITRGVAEYRLALERGRNATTYSRRWRRSPPQKDARSAIELYDKLLETQPESPKLWNERGWRCIRTAASRRRRRATGAR